MIIANSALRASLAIYISSHIQRAVVKYLLNISISIFDRKRLLSLQAYFGVCEDTCRVTSKRTQRKKSQFLFKSLIVMASLGGENNYRLFSQFLHLVSV